MRYTLPMVLVALLATAAPAVAVPMCNGGGPGVHISFGVSVGEPLTESDINAFDLQILQSKGIKATRAERWSDCIRAWVVQPNGREAMEFYDPLTFERVE